ncbi:hypothetical protein ACP70R_011771 [Stipagrostis hirtigluma subsp. patula]
MPRNHPRTGAATKPRSTDWSSHHNRSFCVRRSIVIGCMASSGDVEAVAEPGVEVEQPAAGACDGGSAMAATTITEESGAMVEEHHGTAPEPGQHEDAAPEQAATERSASEVESVEETKAPVAAKEEAGEPETAAGGDEESAQERLKRHRREMAGRVWVPEKWGQEKLLKDWVDCAVFDRPLVPAGLLTARRALVAECCTRRPDRTTTAAAGGSSPLRVRNSCS